jgi:hypothetical protein
MAYQPVTLAALTETHRSRRIDEIDHVPGEPKGMGRRDHRT